MTHRRLGFGGHDVTMTSEPNPQSGENQNPGWMPGHPQQGPGGGYWAAQAPPPPPPPYWPGYSEPGSAWVYGPPPGQAGWPGYSGTNTGGRRHGRHLGLLVAGGVAAVLVAGTTGGFIGDAIGSSGTATATAFTPAQTPARPGSGFGSGPGSGFGSGPGSGFGGVPSGGSGQSPQGGSSSSGSPGTGPADASSIASRVDPGLVDVNVTVDYGQARGAGTGMVLSPDGVVLTNNHVIDGATSISVTDVGNGKTYRARVAGYDRSKDVAILKLSGAASLPTVTIARSAKVSAGQEVVGIGNAGGTGGTPSYAGGTVGATGRSITAADDLSGTSERLTGMIETNADIQPGDSGGPLVNASGQVIGMDAAGSQTSGFATQQATEGFAIPIGTATHVAAQVLGSQPATGVHTGPTAFLGVEIAQGTSGGTAAQGSGVQIAGVVHGSPAAQAGLTAGDVIISVDGHPATSQTTLQHIMVTDLTPGQSVTVSYTSASGQQHTATVNLASGPPA
jgi:S1-C subfamily serine protease